MERGGDRAGRGGQRGKPKRAGVWAERGVGDKEGWEA